MVVSRALTARVFIGTVSTVLFAVTEETTLDTEGVTTGEVTVLAQGLVGVQQGLRLTFLVLQLAVLYSVFPVTSLFLDVEEQTSWATDGLDTLL